MLGFDVENHRNRGMQKRERTVRFVGFDDDQIGVAEAHVRAERRIDRAQNRRRVVAALRQNVRDHRRSRAFAVRARNRDGFFRGVDEVGQKLRAMMLRNAARLRGDALGVGFGDCRRENNRFGRRAEQIKVFGALSERDVDAEFAQLLQMRAVANVRAAHGVAARDQNSRQRAHADAADADEVNPARTVEKIWRKWVEVCEIAPTHECDFNRCVSLSQCEIACQHLASSRRAMK